MSQSHSFSVEYAELYGVECAILINHIQFWIDQNRAMNRNFHDGRTWMYQTQKEIAAIYPYWGEDAVYKIIKKLVDQGVLIKGNFNKTPFDRTIWYAFKNEKIFTKPLNSGMDSAECRNQSRQIAEPIPYTIPDTNQVQQQQRAGASETPVVFAAVFPRSKEEEVQETRAAQPECNITCISSRYQSSCDSAKQPPPNLTSLASSGLQPPKDKIHACLANVDIHKDRKIKITQSYFEDTVKNALGWAAKQPNDSAQDFGDLIEYACKERLFCDSKVKEDKIYPCLLPLPLTRIEMITITKKRPEHKVIDAVKLSHSKKDIQCLAAFIMWASNFDVVPSPEPKKLSPKEQVEQFFTHYETYNEALCFITKEVVAFQRGLNNLEVKFDKYFKWEKIVSLCKSFGINVPETPYIKQAPSW